MGVCACTEGDIVLHPIALEHTGNWNWKTIDRSDRNESLRFSSHYLEPASSHTFRRQYPSEENQWITIEEIVVG